MLDLSAEQERARTAILSWYRSPGRKPYFLLEGPAGTGKTSVITATTESIPGKVVYIAPTAKSALVMRKKGCADARTAHSAIYIPKGLSGNRKLIEMLRELLEAPDGAKAEYLKGQCRPLLEFEFSKSLAGHEQRKSEKNNPQLAEPDRLVALRKALSTNISNPRDLIGANPIFEKNDDSVIKDASLVVCDEVSMMSDSIIDDLLSFGVPVLAQGDPFQLPPVNACAYFSGVKADFLLTEIHRQAKDSPIIQLATLAREGRRIKPGKYGDSEVITYSDKDAAMAADQIIVGTNAQRHKTNAYIRQLKGLDSTLLAVGDRVICRNNDNKLGLINGDQFTVTSFQEGKFKCRVGIENEDISTTVDAHTMLFQGKEVKDLNPWHKKDAQCLQYAYSISGHLSQGSQYDDVYLIDESNVFGHNASKHRYTCITRAAQRITVRL